MVSERFADRSRWRVHTLDDALLWFHPKSGLSVRWDGLAEKALRRTAPRVAMFGITNRCNLTCGFCSRDPNAPSEWTLESAFDVLAGLARRGLLEVAFGGGEPLVYRDFDELVSRLASETPLAIHFTTNGTLLTEERLEKLRPHISEIRLSIYDDNPWPERVAMLAAKGVRFGVNVLVTPDRLGSVPALFERLLGLGCPDIALLSYVGPDASLRLSADEERELGRLVAQSPIRTRISVCTGDRLHPVPRLFEGSDCGAGVDFVVLTSDRKLKACSFQSGGVPVSTADDVIAAWSQDRARWLAPAEHGGCARRSPMRAAPLSQGIRIWQSFSANNSGDCVLVGRFEKVEEAEAYLASLLNGFEPGERFSEVWRDLLVAEGISLKEHSLSPDAITVAGRAVMVHTDQAMGDDFPELRALLWRRGGRAVYNGIHEHDEIRLIRGLRFRTAVALDQAKVDLRDEGDGEPERRGLDLYQLVPIREFKDSDFSLKARMTELEVVAGKYDALFSAEILPIEKETTLKRALSARPPKSGRERFWARFPTAEAALEFAETLEGNAVTADRYLLVEAPSIRPRLGWRASKRGGTGEVFPGEVLHLDVSLWYPPTPPAKGLKAPPPPDIDLAEVASALHGCLPGHTIEPRTCWRGVTIPFETAEPAKVMRSVVDFAAERGMQAWISPSCASDRLVYAIARVESDLDLLERKGRSSPR